MNNYTDHPDYVAMLAACRANLSDDLARLVLADWLDEQGESERAKMIRDYCYFSEACQKVKYTDYIDIRAVIHDYLEMRKILQGQRRKLLDSMPNLNAIPYIAFRRGFISRVDCTQAQWLQHAGEIARHAVLERVELTDGTPLVLRTSSSYCRQLPGNPNLLGGLQGELLDMLGELYPDQIAGRYPDQIAGRFRYSVHRVSFRTHEAALDALSSACIAYAYQQQKGVTA